MNASERKILSNIEEHGCHVTSVFDPEEKEPTFSYSIGLSKNYGVPEVIVVGLTPSLGHALINEYRDRVKDGAQFESGLEYVGFLEGFPVMFEPITSSHKEGYMLSACWLYGGSDFKALQLVYPTTTGIWPWEAGASDWFRANQPTLSAS